MSYEGMYSWESTYKKRVMVVAVVIVVLWCGRVVCNWYVIGVQCAVCSDNAMWYNNMAAKV